jgi:hypothetical protein
MESGFSTVKSPEVICLQLDPNSAEHYIFIPLRTSPVLEVGGARCFWVNTGLPEYIFPNKVGFDALSWTQSKKVHTLFVGRLYKSKSRRSLCFVLKLVRGKCKDSSINLLKATYESGVWITCYVKGMDSHKVFITENEETPHFAPPKLIEQLLVSYLEKTAAIYHAFDQMGGTVDGECHHEFLGERGKFYLNEGQIDRVLSRAFPELNVSDRYKGLDMANLQRFEHLVPYQWNSKSATRQLEHMKKNPSCGINPGEGMSNYCFIISLFADLIINALIIFF